MFCVGAQRSCGGWETSVETSVPGRNGGRLLPGGKKGHKGGGGRPTHAIRQRCADGFDRHIETAEAILRDKKASNADKIRALDVLGKYAGLQKIETENHDGTLEDMMRDLAASDGSGDPGS